MKYLLIALTVCLSWNISLSQEDEQKKEERLEAQKVAFITTKLELTPEEAQQFWPLYNNYSQQANALRDKKRATKHKAGSIKEMSSSEAEKLVDSMFDLDQQELDLKKEYAHNLKNHIPAQKIAMLFQLEYEFRDKLLKSIKRRMKRKRTEKMTD